MKTNNSVSEVFFSSEPMKQAVNYHRWTFDLFKKYLHGDVLEIGCGLGPFTGMIADHPACRFLYAIDISKPAIDMLQATMHRPNLKIELQDAMSVEGQFDSVICMNVMEHVNDDTAFFMKLNSLLRPLYNRFDRDVAHFRKYSRKSFKKLPIPESNHIAEHYYFNSIGALGYWFVYSLMKRIPTDNPKNEIGFFDKVVVPLSRLMLPKKLPIGISLITVIRREK